jgi:hypothetical protein
MLLLWVSEKSIPLIYIVTLKMEAQCCHETHISAYKSEDL